MGRIEQEEELERSRRLEVLKQETDRKLAEYVNRLL